MTAMAKTSLWPTLLVFLLAGSNGCTDICSTETISSLRSPSGANVARFLRRNCGATTGFVYEVEVSSAGGSAAAETVLRFDGNHPTRWPDRETDVLQLRWQGDMLLTGNVSPPVRIFRNADKAGNVRVKFRFSPGTVTA